MPNYTSHVIMANDFFNRLIKNTEIEISLNDLSIASIGQDFTFFDSDLFDKTHTKKVQTFFLNLISYIRYNRLYENSKVMAYLYGHIAHFSLDSILHPLIYAKEKSTKKVTIFPLHTTIEYFIDEYLKLSCEIEDPTKDLLKKEDFFDSGMNHMIDSIYEKTYQKRNTSYLYKKTLWFLKCLDKVSRIKQGDQTILNKLLKYQTYFEKNNISEEFILNRNHYEWFHPFSGKECTDSIDDLYFQSITRALELSNEVNQFLYGKSTFKNIECAFPNLSYDTGIDCSYGKKFIYVRKEK